MDLTGKHAPELSQMSFIWQNQGSITLGADIGQQGREGLSNGLSQTNWSQALTTAGRASRRSRHWPY